MRTSEPTPQLEPLFRPREHAASILQQIECDLEKVEDRDCGSWDDQVEVNPPPYPGISDADILPEFVAATARPPLPAVLQGIQELPIVGRGLPSMLPCGRRPSKAPRPRWLSALRSSGRSPNHRLPCFVRLRRLLPQLRTLLPWVAGGFIRGGAGNRKRRMAERWRYDEDDRFPAFEGPEERERQLVDDYEAK